MNWLEAFPNKNDFFGFRPVLLGFSLFFPLCHVPEVLEIVGTTGL